jgi:hypothetical protein
MLLCVLVAIVVHHAHSSLSIAPSSLIVSQWH